MKPRSVLCSLAVISSLVVACSSPDPVTHTATQAIGETSTPYTSVSPTRTAVPSQIPTASPSPQLTLEECETGQVAFSAGGSGNRSGIYIACSDGSSSMQILAERDVLPEGNWAIIDMAVSPDGEFLAFSVTGTLDSQSGRRPNHLYLMELADFTTVEFYTVPEVDVLFDITWSPDSAYIAYVTSDTINNRVDVLNVDEKKVSTLIEESWDGFGDLAWLDSDPRLFYTRTFGSNPILLEAYIADIFCTPDTYECTLSNQRKVDSIDNPSAQYSQVGISSLLVGAKYESSEKAVIIDLYDLDSGLISSVNLDEQMSTLVYGRHAPSASPDADQVVFVATTTSNPTSMLFGLSFSQQSVYNLSDQLSLHNIAVNNAIWLVSP